MGVRIDEPRHQAAAPQIDDLGVAQRPQVGKVADGGDPAPVDPDRLCRRRVAHRVSGTADEDRAGAPSLLHGRAISAPAPGHTTRRCYVVERMTRIELAFSAWEADVLPLNYTRIGA